MVKLGDLYRSLIYRRRGSRREGLIVSEPVVWCPEGIGDLPNRVLFYVLNSSGEIEFISEGVDNLIVIG